MLEHITENFRYESASTKPQYNLWFYFCIILYLLMYSARSDSRFEHRNLEQRDNRMLKPKEILLQPYDKVMCEIEACKTNYDLFRMLRLICAEYQCQNFMVSEIPRDDEFNLQDTLIVTNWDPELIREFDIDYMDQFTDLYRTLRTTVNPVHLKLPVSFCESGTRTNYCYGAMTNECLFFPVYDRAGKKGMIGFSILETDNGGRLIELGFLSNFVFDKLMAIKKATETRNNSLSDREIQCISWTALGKTSYEIGIILDISLNTVNHYLNNASRKLNCANKTHAVAKCLQDGVI